MCPRSAPRVDLPPPAKSPSYTPTATVHVDGDNSRDKMMPAADGDSWCESSFRQSSQRWFCRGFPGDPDAVFIPAFPHRGTHEDVERLNRLLNIISANHLLPSSASSSDIATAVATGKRTGTEGGGGGDDGHLQQQATLLEHMVETLKQLGSSLLVLHNSSCVPSVTLDELRLYGLILRHVESYMLLYFMEESAKREKVPAELLAKTVEEVGSFLKDNCIDVDESVADTFESVDPFSVWNGFSKLICLLKDFAASISKISLGRDGATVSGRAAFHNIATAMETGAAGHILTPDPLVVTKDSNAGGKGQEYSGGGAFDFKEATKKRKLDTVATHGADEMTSAATESGGKVIAANERVELLFNILRGLKSIGRMRSYAPPSPGEMSYYRLIWAHVMLSIGLINSEPKWGKLRALPEGQYNWTFDFLGPSFNDIDSIPDGWKLIVSLEAVHDLITLVKIGEEHLSDNLGDKGYCSKDIMGNHSKSQKTEREQQSHGFDTVTVNLDFGNPLPQNDERKSMAKTRIECLHDILCLLKIVDWNGPSTTEERRLYVRLLEHVDSSISMCASEKWMHKDSRPSWIAESSCRSPMEKLPRAETTESMRRCEFIIKGLRTDIDVMDGREKTREQCLHEIAVLVDAIESSFLCCLPTAQEMNCYQEIQQHMDINFIRTACPLMTQIFSGKPQLQLHHVALMDQHMKCALELVRKALKLVDEECRKMLWTIIPKVDWECREEFIGDMSSEDEVALKTLLEGQLCNVWKQLKCLDRAIPILDGARMCADRVFNRLVDAMDLLLTATNLMNYEEGMDEVCHVPEVWGVLFELN